MACATWYRNPLLRARSTVWGSLLCPTTAGTHRPTRSCRTILALSFELCLLATGYGAPHAPTLYGNDGACHVPHTAPHAPAVSSSRVEATLTHVPPSCDTVCYPPCALCCASGPLVCASLVETTLMQRYQGLTVAAQVRGGEGG